ncbi:hypothetical protein ABE28_012385 [Peribacillus muralis]|uniref:Uncharacterized protein n=1 Tax=Peribacillus muralis TaxID=264697 RepID=A0A1B3XPJ9_9BACI|nr:hypothetical protein [Peribacillus muralis]AOH55148.1 hypothetical protein ABE28_012385 [Peribacillus muralis]
MTLDWYKGTVLEQEIPDFKVNDVKLITGFQYYLGYNSYYDQVSFLEMDFVLEIEDKKLNLKLKFSDVSSLDLLGFGGQFNQIMGFSVENLNESGYEKQNKYLVEDYENESIKFYCANIEVLSLIKM